MKMCWACNATEVESGLCLPCHSAGKHIPPGPKPEPTQLDKIEAMLAKLLAHMKDTPSIGCFTLKNFQCLSTGQQDKANP